MGHDPAGDPDPVKSLQTAFDAFDRAIATTDTVSGLVTRNSFHAGSEQISVQAQVYPGGETTVTTSFDSRGRETARALAFAGGSTTRAVTNRDLADRDTSWTLGALSPSSAQAFDADGHVTSQGGDGRNAASTYTYDPDSGRKTSESHSFEYGGSWTGSYSYDDGGRLATATVAGVTNSYGYDAAGNLRTVTPGTGSVTTFAYSAVNQLQNKKVDASVTQVYGYEASTGDRVSQGPPATPTQTQYTYNDSQRLTRYVNTGVDATFEYDATGQRTKTVVTQGGSTATTTYRYDGLQLLSLAKKVTGSNTTETVTFAYDASGSPVAGVYRDETAGTTRLFHPVVTDRGDVVELLDASGAPFANYRYDAWGNPTASGTQGSGAITSTLAATIAALQPLRYAGYAYDSFSGHYYCSQRYYDPATYQFITKDPAEADGEESAYQYCGGNPVGKVDSTGLAYATFNGSRFHLYRYLGKGKYKLVGSYRAITGPWKIGYANTGGPIPPGTWTVRESEWDNSRWSPGSWGPWRAPLHPSAGTKAHCSPRSWRS